MGWLDLGLLLDTAVIVSLYFVPKLVNRRPVNAASIVVFGALGLNEFTPLNLQVVSINSLPQVHFSHLTQVFRVWLLGHRLMYPAKVTRILENLVGIPLSLLLLDLFDGQARSDIWQRDLVVVAWFEALALTGGFYWR